MGIFVIARIIRGPGDHVTNTRTRRDTGLPIVKRVPARAWLDVTDLLGKVRKAGPTDPNDEIRSYGKIAWSRYD